MSSIPGLGRSLGDGHGKPTPVFLPGECHGQRSLAGYSLIELQKVGHTTETDKHGPTVS